MERHWLASYPPGVPDSIDPDAYPSLVHQFRECVERFGPRPCFTSLGTTRSYAEIDALSRDFAAYLVEDLGLERGERVAIMMPNLLQYPVALFGALRAGLTVVNVNPLYTPRELRHQLVDSGTATVVILENFAHVLDACLAETPVRNVVVTAMGDLLDFPKSVLVSLVVRYVKRLVPAWRLPGAVFFKTALRHGRRHVGYRDREVGPEDLAFLQYTGGTTGVAKGAMLSHRNMVANVLQASAWLEPAIVEGRELIVTALPLYHIFALTANCLTFMRVGGANHLITNPRDLPAFVAEISKLPYTAITGVNTLFNALLNAPGFAGQDFSTLKLTLGGGMAVQRPVAERWKEVTGTTLIEAYGLTETSPAVCINPLDLSEYNGSVGLPVPSTEVSVRDDAGRDVPLGEPGEVCVRGPQVMRGYWNRPEETADVLSADGWLRTGDIGTLDEQGYLRLVDRKKDLILVSGFNVYPGEVEAVLAEHPGVREVGVIGVPDARSGEVPKAVVVPSDPTLTAETLDGWCRERLTAYKRPRHFVFVDDLPKSNVGKILRRELRDRHGSA